MSYTVQDDNRTVTVECDNCGAILEFKVEVEDLDEDELVDLVDDEVAEQDWVSVFGDHYCGEDCEAEAHEEQALARAKREA